MAKLSARRLRALPTVAVTCCIGTLLTGLAAASRPGTRVDRDLLDALTVRRYSGLWRLAFPFNSDVPEMVVVVGMLACAIALLRRGPRRAVAVAVCVVGATAAAELLKHVGLVTPTAELLGTNRPSWPSSHAAAVTALGGGVLVIPRQSSARAVVAVVAAVVMVACGASLVITRSHRPTDVAGGVLIAGVVCAVVASWLERVTEDTMAQAGAAANLNPAGSIAALMSAVPYKRRLRKALRRAGIEVSRYRPAASQEGRVALLAQQLRISVMLDIGAHLGHYAQSIRDAGYTGRIYSFEPTSAVYSELSVRVADDPLWSCQRVAIGDVSGRATIYLGSDTQTSSLLPMEPITVDALGSVSYVGSETIDVRRLDELVSIEPDDRLFIKIDAQGFEDRVMNGCEALMPSVQMVQIELAVVPSYSGEPDWRVVLDRLEGEGFEVFMLFPTFEHPATGQTLQIDAVLRRRT
jgi:FkbM family methyltransferase